MNTIKTDGLKANISFNSDLLVDNQFIIEPAGVPVPQSTINALSAWESI